MKMKFSDVILIVAAFRTFHNNIAEGQSLQFVTKVALDRDRMLEDGYTVLSIYGHFMNKASIYVQVWEPVSGTNLSKISTSSPTLPEFSLIWQTLVEPRVGNGSAEVIDLMPNESITLKEEYRIGFMNHGYPGPVLEQFAYKPYQENKGVILSLRDKEEMNRSGGYPMSPGQTLEFDDLLLPIHIPVFFCNVTGCPQYLLDEPTIKLRPDPVAGDRSPRPSSGGQSLGAAVYDPSFLTSTEMMMGMLAWNVILTLLVLGLIITVICVGHDVEKLKRKERRLQRTIATSPQASLGMYQHSRSSVVKGFDTAEGFDPVDGFDAGWRTTESWQSDHSIPSIVDDRAALTKRTSTANGSTTPSTVEPPGVLVDSLTY